MKKIISLLIFLCALNSYGALIHNIERGLLHKRGSLKFSSVQINPKQFLVFFKYTVVPKLFVPAPKRFKNGTFKQLLPIEFLTKEGYQILAKKGQLQNEQAKLIFLGYETIGSFVDAYKIKITPVSGKWSGILYYHPNAPELGWIKAKLTINKIKIIGKYTLRSILKE